MTARCHRCQVKSASRTILCGNEGFLQFLVPSFTRLAQPVSRAHAMHELSSEISSLYAISWYLFSPIWYFYMIAYFLSERERVKYERTNGEACAIVLSLSET